MPWKDRSKETQAVWSGLALCAVAAMVITFYLIAGREDRGKESARQAKMELGTLLAGEEAGKRAAAMTKTKRIQEGL